MHVFFSKKATSNVEPVFLKISKNIFTYIESKSDRLITKLQTLITGVL